MQMWHATFWEESCMKKVLTVLVLFAFSIGLVFANGQTEGGFKYPERNVNVIVQYSAGGPTDLSIRNLLNVGSKELPSGINYAVSNVTGGAGLIGLTRFAQTKNDGYTLGVPNIDLAINYALGKTELNPSDFEYIAMALADPYTLIVSEKASYNTLQEYIDYVKANPEKVIVGDSGVGSAPYLCALAIEKKYGLKTIHVSFNGTADIITAIANGTCDVMFIQPSSAASQIEAGNMKMLCTFSADRMMTWPNVPTAKESVSDMDLQLIGWVCLAAPKGTDPQVIAYLKDQLGVASKSADYADNLKKLNMQPITITEDLDSFVANQVQFYQNLCKDLK